MSSAEELVDVVDEDDRVVGRATRGEMRRQNLLHRAVYVIVVDGRDRVFVHRRTTTKDVYSGYWDVTIGGVVGAGEDYAVAAAREAAEEIGAAGVTLTPLFALRYADATTRLIGRAYLARHDGPIVLQAEEIETGAFLTRAEAERVMREERCCPDGVQVLQRYYASARR